jgi:hypothetical protein
VTDTTETHFSTIILAQLGGNMFRAMTGAKDFVFDDDEARTLTFKVGKNDAKVTHVRITLDDSDTYRVEFLRVVTRGGYRVDTLRDDSLVFADSLRQVFTSGTGLDVSL